MTRWRFSSPADDAIDPFVELLHGDGGFAGAGGQQGRLVDQVGQVGADEARGDPGHFLQVHRPIQPHVAAVDFEDVLAAADVGPIDQHVAVEAPRAEQGRIERLGAVGGRHDDHAAVGGEAVHLDQQGVERLLALVVAADDVGAAGLAQGVQLVDEDDAGGLGLGLLEHVADPRRADADEHLDEIGAREAEEGHARLAGDGLGQQRLAGARRTDQQHAPGNPPAEDLVLLRGLEEIDDLAEFLDRFVDAGHVVEGDAHFLLGIELAAAAAEGDGRARPAHLAEHEEHQAHQQRRHHHRGQVMLQEAGRAARPTRWEIRCFCNRLNKSFWSFSTPSRSVRKGTTRLGLLGMRREHLLGHGAGDFQGTDFRTSARFE